MPLSVFSSINKFALNRNVNQKIVFTYPNSLDASLNSIYMTNWVNINYSGPIFKVRASTDSAGSNLQDFYCDFYGNFVTTLPNGNGNSITTWLNGATAYIAVWYDQSINSANISQTNTSTQPIYDYINKIIVFNGGKLLTNTDPSKNIVPRTTPYTIGVKHQQVYLLGSYYSAFCGIGVAGTQGLINVFRIAKGAAPNPYDHYWWNNNVYYNSYSYNNNTTIVVQSGSSPNIKTYINSKLILSSTINGTLNVAPNTSYIGGPPGGGQDSLRGNLYGIFFSPINLSDSDRTILESLYIK